MPVVPCKFSPEDLRDLNRAAKKADVSRSDVIRTGTMALVRSVLAAA